MTVRAEEFGFIGVAESLGYLEKVTAYFAFQLRASLAVVIVNKGMRSIAERTTNVMRDGLRSGAVCNSAERLAVLCVIL